MFENPKVKELMVKLKGDYYTITPRIMELNDEMIDLEGYERSQYFEQLVREVLRKKSENELDRIYIVPQVRTGKNKVLESLLGSVGVLLLMGYSGQEVLKILSNQRNMQLIVSAGLSGEQLVEIVNTLEGQLRLSLVKVISENYHYWEIGKRDIDVSTIPLLFSTVVKPLYENASRREIMFHNIFLHLFSELLKLSLGMGSEFKLFKAGKLVFIGNQVSYKQVGSFYSVLLPIIKINNKLTIIPSISQTVIIPQKRLKIQKLGEQDVNKLNSLLFISEEKKDYIYVKPQLDLLVSSNGVLKKKQVRLVFGVVIDTQPHVAILDNFESVLYLLPIKEILTGTQFELSFRSKPPLLLDVDYEDYTLTALAFFSKVNTLE